MDQPLISVIIPVYNLEKYLDECVGSVIAQTYHNLEIILLDDGSVDSSKEICREYEKSDSRIVFHAHSNQGVGYTRNQGIDLAHGTYILFVDGDDYISIDAVEKLYQGKVRNKSELVTAMYEKADDEHRRLSVVHAEAGTYSLNEYLKLIEHFKIDPFIGGPINKLYDTELLKKYKIRFEENSSYAEDFVFNMKYLKHCQDISVLTDVLYTYRITSVHSLSKRFYDPEKLIRRQRIVLQEYCSVLELAEEDCERQITGFWYYVFLSDLRRVIENRENSFQDKTEQIRQLFHLVDFKNEFLSMKWEPMGLKQRTIFRILSIGNCLKTYRLLCLLLSVQYYTKKENLS